MTTIKIDDKYTVIHDNGVGLRAERYGEEWRDLTGDGLVLAMAQEIEELRDQNAKLREHANQYDPMMGVVASLAAAISLLESHPKYKKGAPSDTMFDQMLVDYKEALRLGREYLLNVKAYTPHPTVRPATERDAGKVDQFRLKIVDGMDGDIVMAMPEGYKDREHVVKMVNALWSKT